MLVRATFDRELRKLQDDVLILGSMAEKAIERSVEALKKRDLELARQVIADDENINRKRFEIEERCIDLIATQQPVAHDLRVIVTVLSIVTELERMGDHAEGIAKICLLLGDEPPLKPFIDIPRMKQKAIDMLHRSLEAFINRDVELAKQICNEDDDVDALYNQLYRELISFMIEDPKTITRATHLTWAGHNLERIADRVTNICERVVFAATGKMEEIGASKY
jgi:phosphate transport system protein